MGEQAGLLGEGRTRQMKYERVEIEVIEIPDGTFGYGTEVLRSCMGLPDGIAEPGTEERE